MISYELITSECCVQHIDYIMVGWLLRYEEFVPDGKDCKNAPLIRRPICEIADTIASCIFVEVNASVEEEAVPSTLEFLRDP